jgi:regulator of RNase E activity RraA
LTITDEVLADLRSLDTPTVCNALEVVAPDRRATGFTVDPLVCARPDLPPIVGFARTVRIRARRGDERSGREAAEARVGYYSYVAEGGARPSVMVIQDLDDPPGFGAWWGEVNTHLHRGLGCAGCVTDGSIRDLDDLAEGFQLLAGRVGPSHAFVHVVDFGSAVTVAGMEVADGDLIHADRHGAVVVPSEVASQVKAAAELIARREAVLIAASKQADFDIEALRSAFREMGDIH